MPLPDITQELLDVIPKVFEPIWDGITSPFTQEMGNHIKKTLTVFNDILTNNTVTIFSDNGIVHKMFMLMQPVGISLLALFFVIDMCKRLIYMETKTPEAILKPCLMLIVGKILIDKSFYIIELIDTIARGIQSGILRLGTNQAEVFSNLELTIGLDTALIDSIIFAIFALVSGILVYAMILVLIIRQFEMGLLTAVAPLFFSFAAGSVTHEPFKQYIKYLCVVIFQTVIMAAGLVLYTTGAMSIMGGINGVSSNAMVSLLGLTTYSLVVLSSKSILKHAIGK